MRWHNKRSYKKRKAILFIITISIFILVLYFYIYVENNIRAKIAVMSEIKARLFATQAINDAVRKKIEMDAFKNLVSIQTDNMGRVTMVQANTSEMNKIAVETSLSIQRELEDIKTKDLYIAIGNIMGSQLFADVGPKMKVKILPAGSVNVNFTTEFSEAGINQTRLKIYMKVDTKVQIIVPFAGNEIDVSTNIPVSETIIVGDVPESYINLPNGSSKFLDLVPTKNPFND
ncbi:sporulation protein YunB [Lutispora thermophila]|uniref:Sporulation protein YunB n=1 Tax=Lutispora thermophila DSM 19022 TaxID=1122184 RepID=A0A1M6GR79_9FIRM|nr:sporulation protein YunB [Lutispora thermophila]SHJ12400.1 sporulation protein YunB [Lutispora thermophila DSM 19022]